MKIEVWCDSGANINSARIEIIDLEDDWDISDEEWEEMEEEDKYDIVEDWARERLDFGWKELE